MFRRPVVARRGPGLVGTMARTAVIAGTATAVSGAVIGHQQKKAAGQQAAAQEAAAVQTLEHQVADLQAQQAQAAVAPAPPPAGAAGAPGTDLMGQLNQLAALKAQGVLTDEEFAMAKAKLLGG